MDVQILEQVLKDNKMLQDKYGHLDFPCPVIPRFESIMMKRCNGVVVKFSYSFL